MEVISSMIVSRDPRSFTLCERAVIRDAQARTQVTIVPTVCPKPRERMIHERQTIPGSPQTSLIMRGDRFEESFDRGSHSIACEKLLQRKVKNDY